MDRAETARPKGLAAFKAAGVKVESAAALKRQPLNGRVVARRATDERTNERTNARDAHSCTHFFHAMEEG